MTAEGADQSPPANDDDISDDELLYRRVHPNQMAPDENSGGWRVSSADWDDPSGEVSVYLQSTLSEDGVEPEAILDGHPEHSLVTVTVGDVRKVSFGVVRDPDPEDDHPRARSHCLLIGLKSGKPGKKTQRAPLAAQSKIVVLREPRE